MDKKNTLIFEGRVFKYGSNIDTDVIIPARYLNTFDSEELAAHCMEDIDKSFSKNVKPGDIILAGENFGSGSSREHAPVSIKASGISCVIAASFARIFYRNAINIGLPILESKDAYLNINPSDIVEVNLENGTIKDKTTNKIFNSKPFPEFMQKIINAGGLINSLKNLLEANNV